MDKISHSEAVSIVKKWFKRKGYDVISREAQTHNSLYKVDLIVQDRDGDYVICEIKCTESDFKNAETQVNEIFRIMQNKLSWDNVRRYIAITRDLYDVFEAKDKFRRIKSSLYQSGIKLLIIYRTKVEQLEYSDW